MRILLISLCFLVVGCASYPKKQKLIPVEIPEKKILNLYFSDTSKDYTYKAKIDAFAKSFGGILVLKKLGEQQHRITFTTEMGNTIFDFTFSGDTFKVNRILKKLDRKLIINMLRKDFMVLIKAAPSIEKAYVKNKIDILETKISSYPHYYYFTDGYLTKILRTARGKEKVQFLFSGISDNIAKHIEIEHRNIKLKIALNAF